MKRDGVFETLVGVGVIVAAIAFLFYAYGAAGKNFGAGAYELNAVFGRVDGVTAGSEVRIAGVKIGAVTDAGLDPLTFEARITMSIDADIQVPSDSVAKVSANGVLGGSHVSIEPGAADQMLAPGEQIILTQGSVDFVSLAVQAFTAPNAGGGGDSRRDDGASALPDLPSFDDDTPTDE